MRFAKAHGLGNDFLLVAQTDAPEAAPEAWVPRVCARTTGVGADGLILYEVESRRRARMTLINADGGEAEISGNGLRCLSAHLWRSGLVEARHVVLTAAGERAVEVAPQGASTARVTCELGRPILASAEIPVRFDPPLDRVVDRAIDVDGRRLSITATSLGNPHCALFLPEPADDALLRELGPRIERHPLFPRRTNVEFVTVVAPAELRVRFWERGVGYTSASGTGAASAAVAAILGGRAERRVTVVCDGGRLEVEWPEGQVLRQTGEVVQVCAGEWQGAALAARQRGEG